MFTNNKPPLTAPLQTPFSLNPRLPPSLLTLLSNITDSISKVKINIESSPSSASAARHFASDTRLLDLPPEIIERVVEHIGAGDFGNLRLTCKALCGPATRPFGHARLAHRRFIFTEHSLRGLIDFTGHPVFGGCIKSLAFPISCVNFETHPSLHDECNPDAKIISQMQFIRDRRYIAMLSEALQNLKAIDNMAITLGCFDDELKEGRRGYGHSTAPDSGLCPRGSFDGLKTIIEVALQCDFPLRALDLDLSVTTYCSQLYQSDVLKRLILSASRHFKPDVNIRYILHHCELGNNSSFSSSLDIQRLANNRLVMSHYALCSRRARLRSVKGPTTVLFSQMGHGFLKGALHRTAFEELILDHTVIDHGSFMEFTRHKARTLRRLELIDVDLAEWDDSGRHGVMFLRYLRDDLHLESLTISHLTGVFWSLNANACKQSYVIGGSGEEKLIFRGKQEIDEKLGELIGKMELWIS